MNMIVIEKQVNTLRKEIWVFTLLRNQLILDSYSMSDRESTRHRKYKTIRYYDRLDRKYCTIDEDLVPLTDELKSEAIKKLSDSIECIKWSERNK